MMACEDKMTDDDEEFTEQREVDGEDGDEDGEEPTSEGPSTIVDVQPRAPSRPKRREVKRREGSVQEQLAMIIARRAVELGDDRKLFTVYEVAKFAWQEAPGVFGMLDGEHPCSHTTVQTLMRARRSELVLFIDDKYGARDEYLERVRRER
jgi:hypothetical protein